MLIWLIRLLCLHKNQRKMISFPKMEVDLTGRKEREGTI